MCGYCPPQSLGWRGCQVDSLVLYDFRSLAKSSPSVSTALHAVSTALMVCIFCAVRTSATRERRAAAARSDGCTQF